LAGRFTGRVPVALVRSVPLSHAGMVHPSGTPRRPSETILARLAGG
jgi:hypothetical protein